MFKYLQINELHVSIFTINNSGKHIFTPLLKKGMRQFINVTPSRRCRLAIKQFRNLADISLFFYSNLDKIDIGR